MAHDSGPDMDNIHSALASFNHLLKGDSQVPVRDAIRGKAVCLYVASSNCRKAREVTPALANVYNSIRYKHGDKFEVIFVSGDEDEESFAQHYNMMPWLALPFDKEKLKFLIRQDLQLMVYNSEGRLEWWNAAWDLLDKGADAIEDMELWKETVVSHPTPQCRSNNVNTRELHQFHHRKAKKKNNFFWSFSS